MKKILIAEDDKRLNAALRIRLTSAGYEVLPVQNGYEALQLTLAEKPDLLILDVWMPVSVGFAVAQRLQDLGIKIPVIFITGSRKPGLWAAAQKVGAIAFVEKPYHAGRLLHAIALALDPERHPTAAAQ